MLDQFPIGTKVVPGNLVKHSGRFTEGKVYEVSAHPDGDSENIVYTDNPSDRHGSGYMYCWGPGCGWFELATSVSKKRKGMR